MTFEQNLTLKLIEQSGRHCDGCSVCCEVLEIDELFKPSNCRCQYQTADGCGIYPARPPVCKHYACAWLAGLVDGDRPSVSGLFIDISDDSAAKGRVVAYELRPHAFASAIGWQTLLVALKAGLGLRVHPPSVGVQGKIGLSLDLPREAIRRAPTYFEFLELVTDWQTAIYQANSLIESSSDPDKTASIVHEYVRRIASMLLGCER